MPQQSTSVKVDWSELGPSLDESCIEDLKIVINNEKEVQIDNKELKESMIDVEPCQDLNITVKLKVRGAKDYIDSLVPLNNKTYKGPVFKVGCSSVQL